MIAIIAIIALLTILAMTAVTSAQEKSRVIACKLQLRKIVQTMKAYVDKNGEWPVKCGLSFLVLKDDLSSNFVCTGLEYDNKGKAHKDEDDDYLTAIGYAGRNNIAHPIDINRLDKMVIAADANDGRGNHKYITNVAYADGTVVQFDARDYEDHLGLLGIDYIPVGPDSPIEELRVLSVE